MSNDKLLNVSNAYMLHCSIKGWGVLMERREEPDRRYLDNLLKGTSQSKKNIRFVIGG